METLLVTGQGAHIKKKKDLLCVIQNKETPEEERTTHLSPIDLNMIILSGELSITTGALRLLALHDVGLVVMDGYGRPFGHFLPLKKGMIIENVERQRDMPHLRSFPVAQEICRAGSTNKATLLQAVGRSMGLDCRSQVAGIRDEVKRIERARSTKELLGYEGSAGRLYFDGIRRFIPQDFGFRERNRHPPRDPINALLSYGYGILYSRIRNAIVTAGLSPYYGVLHSSYKKQEALVYDLVEEFRQPVIDRVILTLVHQGRIKPDQFTCSQEGCTINPKAKKIYASAVMRRLNIEYSYLNRKERFSRIIELQARHYAGFISGEHDYRAFVYR